MVKKLLVAGAAALALSNAAWAQMTTPGSINPGSAGPVGIGPDISAPVPGTAGTVNPADPRRAPSGSRANDSSRMGTTGGVDAGSAVGGTTDSMTGSGALRGSGSLGSGSLGSGSIGSSGVGSGSSGTITSGAGAPLPGAGGMSGSGSMGGAAGTGGAGVGGAGAAGAGGAAGGAR